MPGYTQVGPFSNGIAPGLSAAFFNGLESWIQQTEGDTGASTVSGSTSGTVTLYQALQGPVKYVLILVSGSYNSTLKTIALPVAFTARAAIRVYGNNGPMRFLAGGVAQSVILPVSFNGTTGFATTISTTSIVANLASQNGYIGTAFDTVEFSATAAVGAALIILEGS